MLCRFLRMLHDGFVLLFCSSFTVEYDRERHEALLAAMKDAHEKLERTDAENLASDWANVGGCLSRAMDRDFQ